MFLSNFNLVPMFVISTIKSLNFIKILNKSICHITIKVNNFLRGTCATFEISRVYSKHIVNALSLLSIV